MFQVFTGKVIIIFNRQMQISIFIIYWLKIFVSIEIRDFLN